MGKHWWDPGRVTKNPLVSDPSISMKKIPWLKYSVVILPARTDHTMRLYPPLSVTPVVRTCQDVLGKDILIVT